MKEYGYLFNYLETENIKIDQEEFTFQVQSHPEYPSLLAISDTLSFFKIKSNNNRRINKLIKANLAPLKNKAKNKKKQIK